MPERNCVGCKRQDEWGCTAKRWRDPKQGEPDGPENWLNPAYLPITLMGEDVFACPRQTLKEAPYYWAWLLKFYAMYRKGHLPDKGSVLDQSNKAVELFRILDDVNEQCDRAEREVERARRNQN